jgi:hypothetical protein
MSGNEKPKTVNLRKIFMAELIGPDYSDLHFKIKFYGETPGGKRMDVIIDFPAWGTEHVGAKLHEAQRKQESFLANNRRVLEGKES